MRRGLALGIAVLLATACGGESGPATTATPPAPTSTQVPTTTLPPVTVAPTEGLPRRFPPELVPPGCHVERVGTDRGRYRRLLRDISRL